MINTGTTVMTTAAKSAPKSAEWPAWEATDAIA